MINSSGSNQNKNNTAKRIDAEADIFELLENSESGILDNSQLLPGLGDTQDEVRLNNSVENEGEEINNELLELDIPDFKSNLNVNAHLSNSGFIVKNKNSLEEQIDQQVGAIEAKFNHQEIELDLQDNDKTQLSQLSNNQSNFNQNEQNIIQNVNSDNDFKTNNQISELNDLLNNVEDSINVADFQEGESDKTQVVSGYSERKKDIMNQNFQIKVPIGSSIDEKGKSNYNSYHQTNELDDNLITQSEILRLAQEKIVTLEKENEFLRIKNHELICATDLLREKSDNINLQLQNLQNDREQLKLQFQNENQIIKNQLLKKEYELNQMQSKVEDYDNRLKFDLKNIRIRERELENRLELMRAEKQTLLKSKDDQILDLKRKLDLSQLEVDSFRQKCVELNKVIENNQDSFKKTIRALRLAMTNLELHDDLKINFKKAE